MHLLPFWDGISAIASVSYFANLIVRLWIAVLAVKMMPYIAMLAVTLISIWPQQKK